MEYPAFFTTRLSSGLTGRIDSVIDIHRKIEIGKN
jgi:hypothetical protein